MKKFVDNLLIVTLSSIGLLNIFSGLIAGLWLLVNGGWQLIIFGFILGLIMPFAYSLLLLPSLLFIPLLVKFGEKSNKILFSTIAFLLSFYSNFLLAVWITFIFGLVVQFNYNAILMWLWGYATLMGPIGYMANKEDRDSQGTLLGALYCQIGYSILIFSHFILLSDLIGNSLLWLLLILLSIVSTYLGYTQTFFLRRSKNMVKVENDTLVELGVINNIENVDIEGSEFFCSKCGMKSKSGFTYCKYCGNKL